VHRLDFEIGRATRRASIDTLIVAGWTGRDCAAVDLHIAELEAVGVQRPPTVPCFYRLGANLLTQAAAIDVVGFSSSGEVEIVLVSLADGLHVGVGSDHTDRKVEAYSVTVSKQMCPKPIGCELWKFDDVADHWDELVLRSWVTRQKTRNLYQEGSARKILAAPDLIARYLGRAMSCRWARRCTAERCRSTARFAAASASRSSWTIPGSSESCSTPTSHAAWTSPVDAPGACPSN